MLNENDKNFIVTEVAQIVERKVILRLENNKPSKFVVWSRSWFNYLTPPSIVAAIWFFASYSTESKTLQFDTTNQKETVINHVKSAPDPVVLDMLVKHTTTPGVHMSFDMKDSIYVTRLELDELIKGNAIDVYTMKRSQDKMYLELMEMSKAIKAISYKIDILEK